MIVKVCGVRSAEVVEVARDAGADWIGLVLEPRSPRYVDDAAAREVRAAAKGLDLIGVFVEPEPAECEEAADRYGLAAVQVHGDVAPAFVERCAVPVIRGLNVGSADAAFTTDWWPDGTILLDGPPQAGELPGGTGRRVPLDLARDLALHRRVVLAGGLDAGSVGEAVTVVRPYGVDASSGLERERGVKDPGRVRDFVTAARAAFAALPAAAG